jgi:hypothetical protein
MLIAGRDLVQRARRRVAGAQQAQPELAETRIGAGLGDNGADAG